MNEVLLASHSEAQMSRLRSKEADKKISRLRNESEVERKKRYVREAVLERKQASKVRRPYRQGKREAASVYQDCLI